MYQNIPSEEDFAVSAYIHVYSHCIESDKCDRVQCIQFSLTNRPIREWLTEASTANWILTRNTERPLSNSCSIIKQDGNVFQHQLRFTLLSLPLNHKINVRKKAQVYERFRQSQILNIN